MNLTMRMKKIVILSVSVLIVSFIMCMRGNAVEEKKNTILDNMASFMGAKWGTSASKFLKTFKYKDKLKTKKNFYLENFELENATLGVVDFDFKAKKEKSLKFKKDNYHLLFLEAVIIHFNSNYYEFLYEVFSIKYGLPQKYEEHEIQDRSGVKFIQKVAGWGNPALKRMILLTKFHGQLEEGLEIGIAMFIPYEEKMMKTRREAAEAASKVL